MSHDTATPEGREQRTAELVRDYTKKGNLKAIVRLIGGSIYDLLDYTPADEGEPPQGAEW
jgi:hypothetical protein